MGNRKLTPLFLIRLRGRPMTLSTKETSERHSQKSKALEGLIIGHRLAIQGGPKITERHTSGNNCK